MLTTGIDEKDSNHLSHRADFFVCCLYGVVKHDFSSFFFSTSLEFSSSLSFSNFSSSHPHYYICFFLSLLFCDLTIFHSHPSCRIKPMSVIIYLYLFVDKQILFCLIYMENKKIKKKNIFQ